MARWIFVAAWGAIMLGTPASAQQFIYPAHGQSPAMQQQDQNQCSQWAVQQTGFNPAEDFKPQLLTNGGFDFANTPATTSSSVWCRTWRTASRARPGSWSSTAIHSPTC